MKSCFPLPLLLLTAALHAADLPLHPDDAKIISAIPITENIEIEPAELPAYARKGLFETLATLGLDPAQLKTAGFALKGKKQTLLAFVYDATGHVVALHGNGPWLRNSTLRSFKGLPELRVIRIDHNGFVGKDPRAPEFDGSGFDALVDSKLASISIGLGFADKGMEQCARIKGMSSFTVAHSQVSDAGVAFFAEHPTLTRFSVSEMGASRITPRALASIAKIPNLTTLGFKECFVTYADGFAHLAPLKGKLIEIDLTSTVASPADFAKLKADHPSAKITGILTPEEIVKRHRGVAATLAKQAPPELAEPIKAALNSVK